MNHRFSLRTLLIGVAVVGLGLVFIPFLADIVLPNEVTRAEVNKLKPGMTKDEVRAILGNPDSTKIWKEQPIEDWYYGIWGWRIRFTDEKYVDAELF